MTGGREIAVDNFSDSGQDVNCGSNRIPRTYTSYNQDIEDGTGGEFSKDEEEEEEEYEDINTLGINEDDDETSGLSSDPTDNNLNKEQYHHDHQRQLNNINNQYNDSYFLDILSLVCLENLASRMGGGNSRLGLRTTRDWGKVLSLGEQQRIAFARVLFNMPKVLVMDESTSALDLPTEGVLFGLLKSLGISYLSVGHHASIRKYHTRVLRLGLGPGEEVTWEKNT